MPQAIPIAMIAITVASTAYSVAGSIQSGHQQAAMAEAQGKQSAMQGEMAQTASKAFRQLNDADLKFGIVENEKGQSIELSNATFSQLLISPAREVRKTAFHQYYASYIHRNRYIAGLVYS